MLILNSIFQFPTKALEFAKSGTLEPIARDGNNGT